MPKNYYVVHSNPVEGREDEYNDWYTNQHLKDVIAVPGFVSAQRYIASDVNEDAPFRYMALYELEGDATEALARMSEAVAQGMVLSDSLHTTFSAVVYDELTPLITND
ncbi:DUF4286 family protein [Herbiconiux ginsengi]|uniref:EthD domain-containing protein n=1 Tax=Herbiconiux ginsengi TaxID=381665 RepID=A0A1H3TFT6_9MICO|nr:DUF4286 family protein [Herbiconiux ginsengi]SDZ49114.1 protein of unknown function [Herbiconiux ginsengi]